MKTLIAYDSRFGNTKIIAEAISKVIPGNVRLLHVHRVIASELCDYDLVIIGAPTHGGRPSDEAGELLHRIKSGALVGMMVAAFDTRIPTNWVKFFGYAAPRIAKKLKKAGGKLIIEPEGFFVEDTEGPLAEGEIERAAAWGQEIAARIEMPVPV